MQLNEIVAQIRNLALGAMARGWMSAAELWDVARLCAEEDTGSRALELLQSLLGEERLAHLGSTTDSLETQSLSESGSSSSDPTEEWTTFRSLGEERYHVGEPLGQGGTGRIISALDRETGRIIAKKTLHHGTRAEPRLMAKFVREARITAQLEHPGIVPVYELGTLSDGQPYYTMRVVKRTSLRDVLGEPRLRKCWSLGQLLHAISQVSRALAYAHSRGVLHRDIKPENVLLGDFGEVYLADWGLAKVLPDSPLLFVHREREEEPPMSGTLGYIAPEVIRGEVESIDHRADLFAVGVVLYEVLTGEHPFDAKTGAGITLATCEREPKRPSSIFEGCPLVLEDLCLSLLAKNPGDRPCSADYVASEILAFLEGDKERERRREEARRLCAQADGILARHEQLEAEARVRADLARQLLARVKEWEPVSQKRPGWELEDQAERANLEAGRALAHAIELYKNALEQDPQNAEAHRGLSELYWLRARGAAAERRRATEVYYEALVAQHDDGTYSKLLNAKARLSIRSHPEGAEVSLRRYEERDRVLVPGPELRLGRSPVVEEELEPGNYLAIVRKEGFVEARYPVDLERGAHHEAEVNLYTREEIGEGFIYVPGGLAIVGGDPEANEPLARQTIHVPDFAIAKYPVTMREYCTFLDELERESPELLKRRAPRDRISEGLVVHKGPSGRWEPDPVMIEGEARKLFPLGEGHELRVPIHLVDWFDAVAYCRFRSEREGSIIRLPTEIEWEKAARGTDGRFFPWGDHFDPTFCLMRGSRPYPPQPEPVGSFPTDESPYGVRDMAGGMREWVGDIFGERTAEELSREPEPQPFSDRGSSGWRQVRSGSWNADRFWTRAASRGGQFALVRGTGLGFRVAKSLTPKRG